MDDSTIKGNLLRRRNELHLTQKEMAERLGISLNAYRKIESGKTRIINEKVQKFAESTGTSLSCLVNGFEPVNPDVNTLEDMRRGILEEYSSHEASLLETIEILQEKISLLEETVRDKNEIIETNRKLIAHYEKELSEKGK